MTARVDWIGVIWRYLFPKHLSFKQSKELWGSLVGGLVRLPPWCLLLLFRVLFLLVLSHLAAAVVGTCRATTRPSPPPSASSPQCRNGNRPLAYFLPGSCATAQLSTHPPNTTTRQVHNGAGAAPDPRRRRRRCRRPRPRPRPGQGQGQGHDCQLLGRTDCTAPGGRPG